MLSSECSREGEENSRGKRGETVGSASAFIGDIKREVPFVAEASAWADPGMRRMGMMYIDIIGKERERLVASIPQGWFK